MQKYDLTNHHVDSFTCVTMKNMIVQRNNILLSVPSLFMDIRYEFFRIKFLLVLTLLSVGMIVAD
jgi:hypothetical protein